MEPSRGNAFIKIAIVIVVAIAVICAGIFVGGRFIENEKQQQAVREQEQQQVLAEQKAQEEERIRQEEEAKKAAEAELEAQQKAQEETEAKLAQAREAGEKIKGLSVSVTLAGVGAYAAEKLGIAPEENHDESKTLPVETPTPNPPATGNGKKIAIDAGHQAHGNSEKEPIGPGASETKAKVSSGTHGNTSGLDEYELNLMVSLKLRDELTARGYEVYMVRETHDVNISNSERAKMAADSGANILVRIHANGDDNSSVAGALTMAPGSDNSYLSQDVISASQKLSQKLIDSFCAATGAKNRGVQNYNNMSGINWSTIPVSIVEMGFMTNPDEDAKMATDDYQNKMVQGIANGIDAYYAG